MNEIKLKALELAIAYVGKGVCELNILNKPIRSQPTIQEIAEMVTEVAQIFENYLAGIK